MSESDDVVSIDDSTARQLRFSQPIKNGLVLTRPKALVFYGAWILTIAVACVSVTVQLVNAQTRSTTPLTTTADVTFDVSKSRDTMEPYAAGQLSGGTSKFITKICLHTNEYIL